MSHKSQKEMKTSSVTPEDMDALRAIVEGTASSIGEDFFRDLVRHLAGAIGTRHAFVSEFVPPQRIRTLAYWSNGKIVPNIEYDLPDTPCQEVIDGGLCFYPSGVQRKYPETEPGIESYLGVPLKARDDRILGHLCVFDEAPLPDDSRRLSIFHIFASRAAVEIDRVNLEHELREQEVRLRDLFDEAPIAYVHEDLESRFISANRAAQRILGITPEQAKGMYGKSLVPDTPDAQRRVREALASIDKGTDTSGVVLELRRKDNGKPIWVQWWSKPDPSGTYTRTMFLDITERVLIEQEQAKLKNQNTYLREEIKSENNFEEIVGVSAGLKKVLRKVQPVAPTDATVLITGESGTGKELIARAIHDASPRRDKPFIKVNCAALPTSLVESELFGHERGAFSGAIKRRIGRFELAHTGTIFLDEIGEVPMDVQVKLLRVLQEREFERVGGDQTIKTDARVIAATNRDLLKAVDDEEFRDDLYYRLNVFPVELPPLHERVEDIPLLAQFFVQKYAPRLGRSIEAIDQASMQRLIQYPWPGNIRELENIIERALILNSAPTLEIDAEVLGMGSRSRDQIETVPQTTAAGQTGRNSRNDLDTVQRDHILATLRDTNWVIEGRRGAARQLGLKPGTLRHRMKKLGITRRASQTE